MGWMWRARRGEAGSPRLAWSQVPVFFYLTSEPTDMGKPLDIKSESFKTLKSSCFALFYIFLWKIQTYTKIEQYSKTAYIFLPPPKIMNSSLVMFHFFLYLLPIPFHWSILKKTPNIIIFHIFHSVLNAI